MAEPLTPAGSWQLLAVLRSYGPLYAPFSFQTPGMSRPRRLGRRGDALAVLALSADEDVELLRQGHAKPRLLLRKRLDSGFKTLQLAGPLPTTSKEALDLIYLVKNLCEVIHPLSGVVDVRTAGDHGALSQGERGTPRASRKAKQPAGVGVHGLRGVSQVRRAPLPDLGWLTVFGPEKVREVGASRLLMAPVFLIDTLANGGLLVAATPLPEDVGPSAGRRSLAQKPHLGAEVRWSGAPLLEADVLLPT